MGKLARIFSVLLPAVLAVPTFAQTAISAKAGLIQVVDGDVFVDNEQIQQRIGEFTSVKPGGTLRTEEGRAEVLLTPGTFLRVGESSAFRMISNRLNDTQIELLSGEAMIDIAELPANNAVALRIGAASFQPTKGGIYRFDAKPARLRVYSGEVTVHVGDKTETVRAGREYSLDGETWTMARFDAKSTDTLYRWSERRSEGVAMANVSAARQAGMSNSSLFPAALYSAANGAYNSFWGPSFGPYYGLGLGYGFGSGGLWTYNPFYGMYTFVPYYGTAVSPFGYFYYTPVTVVPVYRAAPVITPTRPVTPPTKPTTPNLPGRSIMPAATVASRLHTTVVTRGAVLAPMRSGMMMAESGGGFSAATGSRSSYGSSGYATAPSSYSAPAASAPRTAVTGATAAPSGGGGGTRQVK